MDVDLEHVTENASTERDADIAADKAKATSFKKVLQCFCEGKQLKLVFTHKVTIPVAVAIKWTCLW